MIISFASAKGGVGKSTISCNISYFLSKQGYKTLLFDSDVGSSVDHLFFNQYKHFTIKDFLNMAEFNIPKSFNEIKQKVNENLDLISSPNGFVEISKEQLDLIKNELMEQNKSNQFVVIDTQAGVHYQNIELMKMCDKIYIIIDYEDTSIEDNYALIRDLQNEGMGILADIYMIANSISDVKLARTIYNDMNNLLIENGHAGIKFAGNIFKSNNLRDAIKNNNLFVEKFRHTSVYSQFAIIAKTMMLGDINNGIE